jgi:hypothetical protein
MTKQSNKYLELYKRFGPNSALLQAILDTEKRDGGLVHFNLFVNNEAIDVNEPVEVVAERLAGEVLEALSAPEVDDPEFF